MALSLLALPALAIAQDARDPLNLGYESATQSHSGFDDETLPADGGAVTDSATEMADADTAPAIERTNDRPKPLDPKASRSSAAAESEPGAMEPEMAAAMPPASGTDAKPAGSRPVPVEPEADDRAAGDDATPAAEDALQRARAFIYDSALEDYAEYEESDGPNWIEANRIVGEIGGWRTYARELFESSNDEEDGQ